MWRPFIESAQKMTSLQIIEHGMLFILLILGLIMFFKSSSPFTRYFIPIVCVLATVLRIIHWAYHGNEPEFMTPLVSWVAGFLI